MVVLCDSRLRAYIPRSVILNMLNMYAFDGEPQSVDAIRIRGCGWALQTVVWLRGGCVQGWREEERGGDGGDDGVLAHLGMTIELLDLLDGTRSSGLVVCLCISIGT